MKNLRERLTYRLLLQLFGLLVVLWIAQFWLRDESVPLAGRMVAPEPLLIILGAVGGLLMIFLPMLFTGLDQSIFPTQDADRPIPQKTQISNRAKMLDLVEQIWVENDYKTGLLQNILNQMHALRIPLNFAEPEKVLHRYDGAEIPLKDSSAILSTYKTLNRKLVILGEPGAGKTVLLLQLAQHLIDEARHEPTKPIPVVLSLTSWAAERLPFEDWLKKELFDKYSLPRKLADSLVLGDQLAYLLDGLDEVAEDYREDCLKAIQHFMEQERPDTDYVLCSRRMQFNALQTRLKVVGEIVMQPLTLNEALAYLEEAEFAGLRALLEESSPLWGLVRVPFMLHIMAAVARGETTTALRLALADKRDGDDLRSYFIGAYLSRRLREKTNPRYPDVKRTRRQLAWLAHKLVSFDQTDFYIEELQPTWLADDDQRKRYRRRTGLAYGLAFGLAVGLAVGLAGGLAVGLAVGLENGLENGGRAVIQHSVLRSMLTHDEHIPRWRYDGFLDYAADLVIMRKVGGGYRFVHDYVRQYLAKECAGNEGLS